MKTWISIFVTSLSLLLFSEMASAVTVRGIRSCGTWVEDRDQEKRGSPRESLGNQSWLIGYLSGLAYESNKEFWGKAGVDSLDNASAFLWVDKYCGKNPLKDVADAAASLFKERTRK